MTDEALPPFQLAVVPVTPFQQNASVLIETATKRAAVIDPGGDVPDLLAAIAETGAIVETILLTHGHIDHAGGAAELKEVLERQTGRTIPVVGPHVADRFLLDGIPEASVRLGISGVRSVTPDRWLDEGDTVTVGGLVFQVMHCPGHSPGSVVLYQEDAGFIFMGDVLFAGSIGRTDFPYGDHDALIAAIKSKLMPLPDHVAFLPGHGRMSTIGAERLSNPYIR